MSVVCFGALSSSLFLSFYFYLQAVTAHLKAFHVVPGDRFSDNKTRKVIPRPSELISATVRNVVC